MIPMPFEYPPRLGWCTKHNSTTVCKDCEIESLREENKRYREALEGIAHSQYSGRYDLFINFVHLTAKAALDTK